MIEVSFVVIARNEESNIAGAVLSIASLHQLPAFEIVIVNDGSTDNTSAQVESLAREIQEIRLLSFQVNRGRGAARSAGLAASKGRLIAFIDADIVLPLDWWIQTSASILSSDACGGIAVPDGEVSFVHRALSLKPRVRPHATSVTGSNGLFRRAVFDVVSFDEDKRNGEDVDLGYRMEAAGLTSISIPWLVVQHNENKSFLESLLWLYESGVGAANQFVERKIWRIPDFATLAFVLVASLAAGLSVTLGSWFWLSVILFFLLTVSAIHMRGKFLDQLNSIKFLAAIVVQSILFFSYFSGRTLGFLLQKIRPIKHA